MKITRKKHLSKGWFTGLVLGVASSAVLVYAATISIPNTFTAGETISAQKMNENFQAIVTSVGDKTVTVNCGTDTISAALAAATPGGALVITVNGTCTENVSITKDDVTLSGGGTGAINGEILIDAARRAVIDGLTVIGTVLAQRNATVTVQTSTIENNAYSGIDVTEGAFAFIDNNTIRGNLGCGVAARSGATVRLRNNIVESAQGDVNICSTIGIYLQASARLAGGNTVTNTGGGYALALDHGSTFRQDLGHDTIVGRVVVFNMTNADFRDVDITGNVSVSLNSVLRLRDQGRVPGNVTVTGTINISSHIANFDGSSPVTVNGDVNCFLDGLAFGSPIFVGGALNCP